MTENITFQQLCSACGKNIVRNNEPCIYLLQKFQAVLKEAEGTEHSQSGEMFHAVYEEKTK